MDIGDLAGWVGDCVAVLSIGVAIWSARAAGRADIRSESSAASLRTIATSHKYTAPTGQPSDSKVQFLIEPDAFSGNVYRLRNIGTETATQVTLTSDEPFHARNLPTNATLESGAAHAFFTRRDISPLPTDLIVVSQQTGAMVVRLPKSVR